MQIDEVTRILSTFSTWATSIVAIIGLLAIVFKPIRKLISWIAKKITGKNETKTLEAIERLDHKIDDLKIRIEEVDQKNDRNERDRLRSEIFRYGNIARRGQHISGEEFRNLQTDYLKYESLGGNSIAHDEYKMIVEYYNGQFNNGGVIYGISE